jgi:hypothetical protein
MMRKYFRLRRIALGLAFAAVAVPVAQAKPVPSTPVGHQPIASERSVQSPAYQLKVEGMRWQAMANEYQAPISQLKVEGMRWQAMAKQYENQSGNTAAGAISRRHSALSKTPVAPVQAVSAVPSDGFNWSDAGIGASVAFGAALILLMAIVLGRRVRSRPTGLASA